MSGEERLLLVDDFVDTVVGVESGLNVLENSNGAVSTSATVLNKCESLFQSKQFILRYIPV